MLVWKRLAIAGLALAASGCATRGFHENAALRAAVPSPPAVEISTYIAPKDDYPTVGGDILRGTSPADLEAAGRGVGETSGRRPRSRRPVRPGNRTARRSEASAGRSSGRAEGGRREPNDPQRLSPPRVAKIPQ